jgi:serine/threonine-protein kinase
MLHRETAVSTTVQHPALNCVLAEYIQTPKPFWVLPFHDGASLRRLLDWSSDSISVPRALNIARQIAEALAALHAAGWLHGQVRADHVLLSPPGQAKLIDLTLAQRLQTAECSVADMAAMDLRYAAPEASCRNYQLTAAADTYSLGIVLFEILTGNAPFRGLSTSDLIRKHRSDAIPDLHATRADVSVEVEHLLRLMLAKEPLRRPSDNELIPWLAELEIAALAV